MSLVVLTVIGLLGRGGVIDRMAQNASVPPDMQAKVEAVRKKVDELVTLEREEKQLLLRIAEGLRRRTK